MKADRRAIAISLVIVAAAGLLFLILRERVTLPNPVPGEPATGSSRIDAVGSRLWSASYRITSSKKTVIVVDPALMGDAGPTAHGVTVSHRHFDHYDADYVRQTAVKVILSTPGTFRVREVDITGIPANHAGFFHPFGRNEVNTHVPSDTIYVFEVDGLRIAHLGDVGQDRLLPFQLEALGRIDILFSKLNNPFVTIDCSRQVKRAFRMIAQLDPKVVIPTHATDRCVLEYSRAAGRQLVVTGNTLFVDKTGVREGPRRIALIQ